MYSIGNGCLIVLFSNVVKYLGWWCWKWPLSYSAKSIIKLVVFFF